MYAAIRCLRFVAAAVLAGAPSAQTTWYVDVSAIPPGNGSALSPYTSIQYAIDQATTASGDHLLVAPGTYVEDVSAISKHVLVRSTDGPLTTRIHGAVTISGALEGFWIGGSKAVLNTFIADVSRCVVDGSVSSSNRGIFMDDATQLDHVTVFGFQTGVLEFLFSGGFSRIENCIFFGNGLDMRLFAACATEPGEGDVVQYSLIGTYQGFGPSCGIGNLLGADPLYWNLAQANVHLLAPSPCIDAGDPSAPLDPDGSRSDMGALPFECLPAESYCTAGVSASGCQAVLTASGTPSVSAPTGFFLIANGVEGNKGGLFFFGTNGRQANSWGNGTSYHCVTPPVARGPLSSSLGTTGACDGGFALDLNAHWTAKPSTKPDLGVFVQAQLWYRDPLNTSNQETSLSDALEFATCP